MNTYIQSKSSHTKNMKKYKAILKDINKDSIAALC